MGVGWVAYGARIWCFAFLVVVLGIQGCWTLNSEGLALLQFRARVNYDPYGVFENWNISEDDPCMWSGVHCKDGRVEMLALNGLSLEGELDAGLGNLSYLRSLFLYNNNFVGAIPKEIGGLLMLEDLDLRNNKFNGTIPAEIGHLLSLKRLLLRNNNFGGNVPVELRKLNQLVELQFDDNLTHSFSAGIHRTNRKLRHYISQSRLKQLKKEDSFIIPIKGTLLSYLNVLPLFRAGRSRPADNCCLNLEVAPAITYVESIENASHFLRRKLLQQSNNLEAAPVKGGSPLEQAHSVPISRSSGSFPADMSYRNERPASPPVAIPFQPSTDQNPDKPIIGQNHPPGQSTWKYVGAALGASFLLIVATAIFCMCRNQPIASIGPWKTGISGQLQKAFVTGVPKLNRAELETACEDFSNIIDTVEGCTVYKGTLSSGVEIAVGSTAVSSAKDWSKRSELLYQKKIDMLSRVNHKNFVNLIGYCEEDEPFTRMMVFEYAPNGTLFEHLHVKEFEHLDWSARTRIIMGIAYCLQHMHELNPPVFHGNLDSNCIFLTDDYAAKIVELGFWKEFAIASKASSETESENYELPPLADPEANVYSFGLLLLEIISGKLLYSDEYGPLEKWASQYLNDQCKVSHIIDLTLKSFKDNELHIICEVIQDCIQEDARKRPTMKGITTKLKKVTGISPEAATPRLSPLWWAELEILSSEAA